jgi:hypothetical protein
MNLWKYLPRITYIPPVAGVEDYFSNTYKATEAWSKVAGWCIVIGTLHYGFVKTNSLFFGMPEGVLTTFLALLVYGYYIAEGEDNRVLCPPHTV